MQTSTNPSGEQTHLRKSLASFLLRHVALGDVLLEGGEQRPEQLVVISEQPRLCYTARVQG